MSPTCERKKNPKEQNHPIEQVLDKKEEKKIDYTFTGDYSSQWKSVDSLERIGLVKSALEKVQVIFYQARQDQNSPEVVRSVIYKMKYNSYLMEDDYIQAIHALNDLAGESEFPLKQIIHSITADVYWRYYEINRWKFMNRTQTIGFKNEDIRTWDISRIMQQTNLHYFASLEENEKLKLVDLNDFKAMLNFQTQTEILRPTLYDFLAHRALDHFKNSESSITRPADKFKVKGSEYFSDAATFSKLVVDSKDSMSNELHATKLYIELTKFHLNDSKPDALIDLELNRLLFFRNNSEDKTSHENYIKAIQRLAEKYSDSEQFAEIRYYEAQYFSTEASKYSPENPEHKDAFLKAEMICQEAIHRYPNSYGAQKCKSLLNSIQAKELSFEVETVNMPNAKGRIKVSFKNVDSVYFRIVEVDRLYFLKRRPYGEELIQELLKQKQITNWTAKLNDPGDHHKHSTEIILPELPLGQYVLIASPYKDFRLSGTSISHSSFWVSAMAYSYRKNENESLDGVVTNRETGEPLSNVNVTVYTNKYSYSSRTYELIKEETITTDAKGIFTVKSKGEYRDIYLDLSNGNDHFNSMYQLYLSRPYNDRSRTTTTFFTDRKIYRPGQLVHFKGIRIKHNGESHTLETGKQRIVKLYDVNYQVIGELKLTTNSYGTFSGSFKIPEGGITGQMSIRDGNDTYYFSVEEYKRPRFEANFDPIQGVYKLGEKITFEGKAVAFSGSVIDGATVKYRVTRNCDFPGWVYYRWGYYPVSSSVEITNGELTTNENGNFTIAFNAEEDTEVDHKFSPYYTYTVTADVTDITGETHSTTGYVTVGTEAMRLSVDVESNLERNGKNKIKVHTANLNGSEVNAQGTIRITKLIEPDQLYRTAAWKRPDIQSISEQDFRKLFPHDEFGTENALNNYKKGEEVFNRSFDTEKNDSIELIGLNTWETGRYVIESEARDSFGVLVKDIRYIVILDKNATKNATNDLWNIVPIKTQCEPGEQAEFIISSAATDFRVLYEIEYKGTIVKREWLTLSNSQKRILIPIEEKHRGNLTVHFYGVKYGRSFTSHQTVYVPYSNKELDITFETFRDKLLPGQKEQWRLKIKGPEGEKVAAEMIAAMYDASLDEFAANSFYLNVFNARYSNRYWYGNAFGVRNSDSYYNDWNPYFYVADRLYSTLNWWGFNQMEGSYYYRYNYASNLGATTVMADSYAFSVDEVSIAEEKESGGKLLENKGSKNDKDGFAATGNTRTESPREEDNRENMAGEKSERGLENVKARSNFNETAFFYPQLMTNDKGEVIIQFEIPESLTKWKFMGLAHTKDLKTGFFSREVVTQKELMITSNAPRFLREGDAISFSAKVSNISGEDLNGTAQLFLFDALTMQPIDVEFENKQAIQNFSVKKGQSSPLSWDIKIPSGYSAVTYRIVAKTAKHSDGEENVLPILSNRLLVTEAMPLPSKGIGTKEFTFDKLLHSDTSKTLVHHKLTLEYTSNPAWYAIQALPYMMEYPYECSEQVFSRFYANSLASVIINSNPKIKEVFNAWKESSPEAFLSNLEKNQELKSLILEETPWVMDAQNESERKKRIALLFDLSKMDRELDKALHKLEKMQVVNGGWPWFPGMEDSRYISQHIISGMGHLDHLKVRMIREDKRLWNMITKGVRYLDARIIEDYNWLKTHDAKYLTEQRIDQTDIQYLYARSYFLDIPISAELKEAIDYYQQQANDYWLNFNYYNQGMIALEAKRFGIEKLPSTILASIKEKAIYHEELGMYWKDNISGYYWYQAPIETQALLIEAFDEISNDLVSVEEMKVWLLKQKQTTDWKTTKATAEACYALLLRGTELLTNTEQVKIKMNSELLDPKALGAKVEAGTGYFKTSWEGEEIKPEMGKITVIRETEGVSWGAVYWQYFEDMDKITPHETPLHLSKQLFLVVNTPSGPVMTPITDETQLKPGDKIRVRIELRSDRNMEYVHMKDMRAAGFEPLNVFSQYKWQDGLGYYESTKDAATNFFMDYLPKGTYVFEYDMVVTHYGDFANGITTIQCMYAPEFTSHSEGVRVKVVEKEK